MRAKRTIVGMILALAAAALAAACDSAGGGAKCFGPAYGPPEPSCAAFDVGLTCPVGSEPFYTCVCTKTDDGQTWVCSPGAGTTSGGGAGGMNAGGGGMGTGGSGTGGSTTGGTGGGDGGT